MSSKMTFEVYLGSNLKLYVQLKRLKYSIVCPVTQGKRPDTQGKRVLLVTPLTFHFSSKLVRFKLFVVDYICRP